MRAPRKEAIVFAITAAWLYPLARYLVQCRGTGMTRSTSLNMGEDAISEASREEKNLPAGKSLLYFRFFVMAE